MEVDTGPVDCDWRVGTNSCDNEHEKMILHIVLILCVCCYLILAIIGYGILWARKRYNLSPPGPIIDFHHPDGGIRPQPIESFCVFSIAGLLVRSVSIILVIIDAFPNSTTVQELMSEIAVCCSFPCWACFVIGVWFSTPRLSVPGDNLKIRVPRPKVINGIFFFLLFGPFLLDLPAVICTGAFLHRKQYTKTNTAVAVHFINLGLVILFATGLFYFTLNQLAKAIAEYTVPAELTLVHLDLAVATPDSATGQTFTLGPLPEDERTEDEGSNRMAKVRLRLLSIRNAGTVMLCFYVVMYLVYGIARPIIHRNMVLNIVFCVFFNLDPGTPTIFVYFIFSILYHARREPLQLHQVYSSGLAPISTPPRAHASSNRPRSDSYLYSAEPLARPSMRTDAFGHRSFDLSDLRDKPYKDNPLSDLSVVFPIPSPPTAASHSSRTVQSAGLSDSNRA